MRTHALIKKIEKAAEKRVYFDAANLVVIGLREGQKQTWIKAFPKCTGFENRSKGLEMLLGCPELLCRAEAVGRDLKPAEIKQRYESEVDDLLGKEASPRYGFGSWLSRMSGKGFLKEVLKGCVKVVNTEKKTVQGSGALQMVARELVSRGLSCQPSGFQELHRLLATKVPKVS